MAKPSSHEHRIHSDWVSRQECQPKDPETLLYSVVHFGMLSSKDGCQTRSAVQYAAVTTCSKFAAAASSPLGNRKQPAGIVHLKGHGRTCSLIQLYHMHVWRKGPRDQIKRHSDGNDCEVA